MTPNAQLALIAMAGLQIGALIALIGNWITNYYGYKKTEAAATRAEAATIRVEQAAARAAREVTAVKDTLQANTTMTEGKLDGLAIVAKASHTLINNEKGLVLDKYRKKARAHADLTRNLGDIREAELAEEEYSEHLKAQAVVDAQPGTAAQKKGDGDHDDRINLTSRAAPADTPPHGTPIVPRGDL